MPGPTSGTVYLSFEPGTTGTETPLGCHVDSGPPLYCMGGYNDGLAMDCSAIPTDTTYQVTATFQAPAVPGTYTMRVWIYAFPDPNPWTEYNPDNDSVTLTYQVGYWA